jgi:hypothetical protein
MWSYLHDEICKITHTDYSYYWYIRRRLQYGHIFMTRFAKSHTHTSILLPSRRSCCTWSLNKLHHYWWLRELIPGLQWNHKAFWTCTLVCNIHSRVEGESIGKIMTIRQRMKDCSSWKQWSLDTGWNCSSWCQEVLGYLPQTRLRGRSMSQEFFSQLC